MTGHRELPMPGDTTCPAGGAKVYARASGPVGRYPKEAGSRDIAAAAGERFPVGQQQGVPS